MNANGTEAKLKMTTQKATTPASSEIELTTRVSPSKARVTPAVRYTGARMRRIGRDAACQRRQKTKSDAASAGSPTTMSTTLIAATAPGESTSKKAFAGHSGQSSATSSKKAVSREPTVRIRYAVVTIP